MKVTWIPLSLLAMAVSLTSCSEPLSIVISPELADLAGPLKQALADQGTSIDIGAEGDQAPGAAVLRLTTTPGENLQPGTLKAQPFPSDWDGGAFPVLGALKTVVSPTDGEWTALPLLFDLQGVTVFVNDPKAPALPQTRWNDLEGPAGTVVMEGNRPSVRQSAFFLSGEDRKNFGSLTLARHWAPNTWFWTRADLATVYKPASSLVFLESYRDYELGNPGGTRRFSPLVSEQDGRYTVTGTVVFLEHRGQDVSQAVQLVRTILASGFIKRAGMTHKWLAASFNAPEIDGDGAHARQVVQRAARFVPVTDRLPDPLVEGSLVTEIQLAVDKTPRP